MFSVIQLSFGLQILEREVNPEFKNLTTTIWNVIITLTSVGYGDYYPKSDGGRIIAITTAFWGICFLSLLVVALTNVLSLEESEEQAFTLLKKLYVRQQMKENGIRMIQNMYKVIIEERKDKKD